jgi:hypothetical protein
LNHFSFHGLLSVELLSGFCRVLSGRAIPASAWRIITTGSRRITLKRKAIALELPRVIHTFFYYVTGKKVENAAAITSSTFLSFEKRPRAFP